MARKKQFKVKGLKNVIKNLNKQIDFMDDGVRVGLQKAGLFIKMESQENTPHEFGVLVSSAFYRTAKTSKGWVLRVGYTAHYAPYVHEMPASYNFSKPDTGPKFLFNAVFNNEATILRLIKNEARV